MGMGFGLSNAAAAGADELTQVLAQKRLEQLDRQRAREARERIEQQNRAAAEQVRQFEARHALDLENSTALRDQRAAQAERDRAAAEKEAARQKGLQDLIGNPNALSGMTPLQRALTLQQFNVNNLPFHEAIETPGEHATHRGVTDDAAFADFQRRQDYTEGLRRSRPDTPSAAEQRAGQDDPSLPIGTQRYLIEIARKHRGNPEAAQAELAAYLQDPGTQQDHPRLSPVKAADALRRQLGGGGGGDDFDALIADAFRSEAPASGGAPRIGTVGGQRVVRGAASGAGEIPPAAREQARQLLRGALGRTVTDADVDKFLSSPQNRAAVGIR